MKNEFPQYSCPIEVEARISLQDFFQVFFSQSKLSFDDNWPITGLESGNIEKKNDCSCVYQPCHLVNMFYLERIQDTIIKVRTKKYYLSFRLSKG